MTRCWASTACLALALAGEVTAGFDQEIVVDTAVNYLYNSPQITEAQGEQRHVELEHRIDTGQIDYSRDFYFIFRYRDIDMVPLWDRVLAEKRDNPILTLWYINAVAQLGVDSLLYKVAGFRESPNSIEREYAANAYAYLGSTRHMDTLNAWIAAEANDYVKETLKSSIRVISAGGYPSRIEYLPRFYEFTPRKLVFFYNVFVNTQKGYLRTVKDSVGASIETPVTTSVFPHQQYHWRIKNAPRAGTFGNRHGDRYHTGVDSGWLFDGLPVHAMAAGVVRMIQHETSWGNLVVIESSLSDSEYVCQIYGHLGKDLDVGVGESVYAGQKIGQIGNSFSYENGGYVGHVHVGIELSRFKSARLGGYDRSVEWYASPKSFVALVAKRAAGRAETDAVQQ